MAILRLTDATTRRIHVLCRMRSKQKQSGVIRVLRVFKKGSLTQIHCQTKICEELVITLSICIKKGHLQE